MTTYEIEQLKKVTDFLNSISGNMINELKEVVAGDLGLNNPSEEANIEFVDFSINEDVYTLFLHPMDAENSQLGYKKLLKDFPNGILRANDLDIDTEVYDFDNDDDMDRLDEYYLNLRNEFIKWFSTCWDEAGGQSATHTFYFSPHDEYASFDLKTKKWIEH